MIIITIKLITIVITIMTIMITTVRIMIIRMVITMMIIIKVMWDLLVQYDYHINTRRPDIILVGKRRIRYGYLQCQLISIWSRKKIKK